MSRFRLGKKKEPEPWLGSAARSQPQPEPPARRPTARERKAGQLGAVSRELETFLKRAVRAADDGDVHAEEAAIRSARQHAQQNEPTWTGKASRVAEQQITGLVRARKIRRGRYIGNVGEYEIFSDRILAGTKVHAVDAHVIATVETAGNLVETKRPTLTRMAVGSVLPGSALIPGLVFQKTETKDMRELYLLIEHPEWAELIKVDPNHGEAVRQIAAKLNQAVRQLAAATPDARGASRLEDLERLARLRESGTLTDAEFAAEKQRILGG